ncbi:MAG TPA: gluconate 2-dehydrogenase subunit 3 family protein [Opitutaceae bacterium]|nr:gluconate 2-dehydrogenase subunit 3 family protein [Opitutaceae bacterium]
MTRREAVIRLATLMGATVVGPRLLAASFGHDHAAANSGAGATEFSASDIALLDEIGDTIIPETDIPGAKATGIGAFIAMMVRECYVPQNQATFKDGLKKIADTFTARFGGTFLQGSAADRTTLLNELDREQRLYTAKKKDPIMHGPEVEEPFHYFRLMKELTLLGYFSSEIGCTQALRFSEVPGKFDGAAPYQKGDHAWFS